MTSREQLKILRELAEGKSAFIDEQLAKLEKQLDKLGPELANKLAKEFLDQLDVKDGIIEITTTNQSRVAIVDRVVNLFWQERAYKVITAMITDLQKLNTLNEKYFNTLAAERIDNKKILSVINNRLGMNDDGSIKRNGFMNGLITNSAVKNQIRDFAMEKITTGTGFEDMRRGMRELITGNENKMGAFKQFYRNAAYDLYAKVDALNGNLYGDKLELSCFIYAGTRRKTSRHFCIQRKGKVFTREEAAEWKDLIGTYTVGENGKRVPAGPILINEDAETYNPFVDRGGYGCVDDIMWIGDTVALSMRPDLKEYFDKKKTKKQ
ncbi:MAG: hypothetical protein ACTHLE_03570 [Agriterribacter sp.]